MAITISASVGSTCTVGSPANIAITGLTASTKYAVLKQDPNGGSHTSMITSDVSGAINTTWVPTTAGTLSVTVYPVTEIFQTGTAPSSTFPAMRNPSLLIGTSVLTPQAFNVISGD